MTTPLTHFVQQMDPQGPGPTDDGFAAVWDSLRALLASEMKRRSSWLSPPSYLGVVGHSAWTAPGRDSDALDELAAECFEFIFVRRLPSLRAQAQHKPTVDGLVKLNIRHFLLEAQRRNDPLGFRVYEVVHRAILKLLEGGRLFVLEGREKVRNDTLLAVAASVPAETLQDIDPGPLADRWAGDYLDPIVTASHKALAELLRTLGDELMTWLGDTGPGFRFGDLVAALKARVRYAWKERYVSSASTPGPTMERPGEADPGGQIRFEALGRCVEQSIDEAGGREKTRLYLKRLWSFLVTFAADGLELHRGGPVNGDELPPHRHLAKLLNIPRERIPGLLDTLGEYLRSCQQEIDSLEKGAMMASPPPTQSPRERALASARAAHARDQGSAKRTQAIRAGDVVALPDVRVPGVLWLLLDAGSRGGFRAAPVDSFPFVGPRDIPLPERETREPWVLRREFELDLPSSLLERATLADHLDPEVLQAALRDPDLGSRHPVDADQPAYREWIDGGPRAAYQKLRSRPLPFSEKTSTPLSSNPFLWLAAVLALLSVGLGLHVGRLKSLIEELSEPIVDPPIREIQFQPSPRGPWTLEVPEGEAHVGITLLLEDLPPYPRYRIEARNAAGDLILQSQDLQAKGEYTVTLAVHTLEGGTVTFYLYGAKAESSTLLDKQKAEVVKTK